MLHEYLELLTNVPHLMVELTFMIVVDVFILGIAWPFAKRWIIRHDKEKHANDN
jgi:hypothetical protein